MVKMKGDCTDENVSVYLRWKKILAVHDLSGKPMLGSIGMIRLYAWSKWYQINAWFKNENNKNGWLFHNDIWLVHEPLLSAKDTCTYILAS